MSGDMLVSMYDLHTMGIILIDQTYHWTDASPALVPLLKHY